MLDHLPDPVDIGTVDHGVDDQWQSEPDHFASNRALSRIGAVIACYSVGGGCIAVLDRDLDVVEARLRQRRERLRSEPDG